MRCYILNMTLTSQIFGHKISFCCGLVPATVTKEKKKLVGFFEIYLVLLVYSEIG